jgi:hypothetical protein
LTNALWRLANNFYRNIEEASDNGCSPGYHRAHSRRLAQVFAVATLGIGEDGVITLMGKVAPGLASGQIFNSKATISGSPADEALDNNSQTATAEVNEAPEVDAGSAPDVVNGQLWQLVATFTDVETSDTHRAIIDWGDGSVEPAVVDENGGTVLGHHIYGVTGPVTVTVTVFDSAGGLGQDTLQFEVGDAGLLLPVILH